MSRWIRRVAVVVVGDRGGRLQPIGRARRNRRILRSKRRAGGGHPVESSVSPRREYWRIDLQCLPR
jgi:hypothetical protein